MNDFMRLFESKKRQNWRLEFYYSSIVGYRIIIVAEHENVPNLTIIDVENCDHEYLFAKASVSLKDFLLETYGGY